MAWTWLPMREEMVTSDLIATLNERMVRLQGELALVAKLFPVHALVNTTDATVTTLYAVAVPVNTTTLCDGYVAARRTGGAAGSQYDLAGYTVQFVAKGKDGSAVAIPSGGTVVALGESQAAWNVTVVDSTIAILIKVTGAVNNNITWVGNFRTISV